MRDQTKDGQVTRLIYIITYEVWDTRPILFDPTYSDKRILSRSFTTDSWSYVNQYTSILRHSKSHGHAQSLSSTWNNIVSDAICIRSRGTLAILPFALLAAARVEVRLVPAGAKLSVACLGFELDVVFFFAGALVAWLSGASQRMITSNGKRKNTYLNTDALFVRFALAGGSGSSSSSSSLGSDSDSDYTQLRIC